MTKVKEEEEVTKVVEKGEFCKEFLWVKTGEGEVHVSSSEGVFMPNLLNETKARSVVQLRNFLLANPEVKELIFVDAKNEEAKVSSASFIKDGA